MSRTNYIFVDFENVRETELDRIANKPVKVVLVVGEQDKKLPVTLVRKLLQYSSQVQLVETGGRGRNAADLVLAHYIGEFKKTDAHGYIHIVSNDTDFDALIGHYKLNGTLAARHGSFADIPVLMQNGERVKYVAAKLNAVGASRPRQRKTLESHLQAQFGRSLADEELEATIQGLIAAKIITLSKLGEVAYPSFSATLLATAKPSTPSPKQEPSPKPTKPNAAPKSEAQLVVLTELATQALERLRLCPNNRPKDKEALARYLFSRLGNRHPDPVIYSTIKNLRQAGYLSFVKKAVTYHL